ncbi:MAG: oxidoreductase, partial [Pseudomonadota bacterium]|nr:oxidoreductase [Pseudomonadota bacterium]
VVVIAPGPIKTPIWEKFDGDKLTKRAANSAYKKPLERMLSFSKQMEQTGFPPEIIANRVISVLQDSKPKTRYTIDAQWMQNSLLSLMPKRVADRMIAKQMELGQK